MKRKLGASDDESSSKLVCIWTDGACANNGRRGATAGVGVFFGDRHALNVCERLQGRQTNQRAELTAAIRAVQLLDAIDASGVSAEIFSDSKYVVDGVTQWIVKWRARNWCIKNQNIDLWQRLDVLVRTKPHRLRWTHVRGHANVYGNEQADRLACAGAKLPLRAEPTSTPVYTATSGASLYEKLASRK